jgi:hypothetical protein
MPRIARRGDEMLLHAEQRQRRIGFAVDRALHTWPCAVFQST